MLTRERICDSLPRRSSPSPTRDRDVNASSMVIRRDVSSRSPFPIDGEIEVRRTVSEQDVDEIRREIRYPAPYEQKRHGFFDGDRDYERHREQSHLHRKGVDYPNRSDSSETVMRSSEDPYPNCLRDEPESSRFIASRDYKYSPSHERNVLKNDETNRFESDSRHRLIPLSTSEVKQNGERYSEDRDIHRNSSSPLSQIGSSGDDFQDESSKCCIRANDLDRVNDTRPSYSGNRCASQDLQTRDLDDHVGRNSLRNQQGESMRDFSRGSPVVSRSGKEIVDESRKICQIGSDIEEGELPCVGIDVKNIARETDILTQARGYLSKSYVCGSNVVDVNTADTHLEVFTKEKPTDQHDFVKKQYRFVELGSSVVNKQDDKAHHHMNFHHRERDAVCLDQKRQLLEKDYQYDGVDSGMNLDSNGPNAVSDRCDNAPQSKRLCLNKEREADLDNVRKAVYSDDKTRELRNEYRFGNDDRMHSDLHEADIVVDRDDKAPQNITICLNKESEAYVNNERKATYLDGEIRELRNRYHFGNDSRMHSDLHEGEIVVDRDGRVVVDRDGKEDQLRRVCLNKESEAYLDNERKAAYLDDERRELRNKNHFGNDSRMHSNLHEGDIVVDRDGKVDQFRRVCLSKGEAAYLDNERRDVYLHYRSQQLKKDYDSGIDARIYPDVRKVDTLVDHEDGRGLRYRGGSLNDRNEAYLYCESQQRLKDHETAPYGMIHPDVYKSDFLVNREDARALELRGVSFDSGKESYLDNERGEGYLRHKNQPQIKDYDYGTDDRIHRDDVKSSDIIVDHGDARALARRGISFNDENESYLDNERGEGYLRYQNQQRMKDYDYGTDGRIYRDLNSSDIIVDHGGTRALERRGISFDDRKESYLDKERGDAYLRYKNQQRKKDYNYGIDDRIYRDVNRSDIIVDHGDARALERRGISFNEEKEAHLDNERRDVYMCYENQQLKKGYDFGIDDRMYHDGNRSQIVVDQKVARGLEYPNEAYLDNGRGDAYPRYKVQQVKKDYDSGIDSRMCHDVNRSEIVVDWERARALEGRGASSYDGREAYLHHENQQLPKVHETDSYGFNRSKILVDQDVARALERRGASLYDERDAYVHHESQQLLKDHETDSYGMMLPDASRSYGGKQDEEARRSRRYLYDDRKQVSLNGDCLQLRNGGHVNAHANMRYQDGRQEVYHSNDDILRTRDGNSIRSGVVDEVIHEKRANGYNYSNAKQSGMSYEKPYSGRYRDHEPAYDHRDKLGHYAVEGGTSTEEFRYLADERNFGNDDHVSAPCRRVSAKERLGGRVEDSRVPVKYRLHGVKNSKHKR